MSGVSACRYVEARHGNDMRTQKVARGGIRPRLADAYHVHSIFVEDQVRARQQLTCRERGPPRAGARRLRRQSPAWNDCRILVACSGRREPVGRSSRVARVPKHRRCQSDGGVGEVAGGGRRNSYRPPAPTRQGAAGAPRGRSPPRRTGEAARRRSSGRRRERRAVHRCRWYARKQGSCAPGANCAAPTKQNDCHDDDASSKLGA